MSVTSFQNSVPSFGESEPTIRTDVDVTKCDPRTRESPIVIKPVARKALVKPAPMKPVVMKPLALKPFPAFSPANHPIHGDSRMAAQVEGAGRQRRSDQPSEEKLKQLVDEILAPVASNPENDFDSDTNTESGFSDGVTLDVSIAEVSNLTSPTALVSRPVSPGCHHRSGESEDGDRSMSKSVDLIEAEAKRSEASSSQTSEAAAPLIARAMRKIPMSDEISTDSYFWTHLQSAKRRETSGWDARNILESNRETPSTTNSYSEGLSEEKKDDDYDQLERSWNVQQMNALFPSESRTMEKPAFAVHSGDNNKSSEGKSTNWDPFLETPEPSVSPDSVHSFFQDVEEHLDRASRSETPTRTNRSRRSQLEPLNSSPKVPDSSDPMHPSPDDFLGMSKQYLASRGRPGSDYGASVYSVRSIPVFIPPMSNTSGNDYAASAVTTGGLNVSGHNSYGPKHAALLARIRTLKEARLRRAAAIYGRSSLSMFEDFSQSTGNSSTKFGGASFMASLEVD